MRFWSRGFCFGGRSWPFEWHKFRRRGRLLLFYWGEDLRGILDSTVSYFRINLHNWGFYANTLIVVVVVAKWRWATRMWAIWLTRFRFFEWRIKRGKHKHTGIGGTFREKGFERLL
jgi:hypothetical protein